MKRVPIVMVVLLVAASASAWEFSSFETDGEVTFAASLRAQAFRGSPSAPTFGIMYTPGTGYEVLIHSGGPHLSRDIDTLVVIFTMNGPDQGWPMKVPTDLPYIAAIEYSDVFLSFIRTDYLGLGLLKADGTQVSARWDVSGLSLVMSALKLR